MRWVVLGLILGAVVSSWIVPGLWAASALERPWAHVNPLLHSVTLELEFEVPESRYARAGMVFAVDASQTLCEANVPQLPGFGWSITMVAKNGMPLISCWSWR